MRRPQPGVSATQVRASLYALRGIPQVLDEMAVPAEQVLRPVGLTREDFDDTERSTTFAVFDRLFGLCVQHTGCGHFGLLVGQKTSMQSFGLAGRIALTAPNVGEALRGLSRYFVLHDSGGVTSLAEQDGTATLSYGIHAVSLDHADQAYDLAVATMLEVMQQLCGATWRPEAVLLPRRRPADIRPYRAVLQAPLRFDAAQASVQFASVWLERPVASADPLLHSLVKQHVSSALEYTDPMLANAVCRAIRHAMASGTVSRAAVAGQLGLHPRTLVRRLTERGTSFQVLLDDTRAHVARQLLRDTRTPVSRIASTLGYRDSTVFARAFRRWTGQTPRHYRSVLSQES